MTLYTALALSLATVSAVKAFTPSFSAPVQCSTFTVSYSYEQTAPAEVHMSFIPLDTNPLAPAPAPYTVSVPCHPEGHSKLQTLTIPSLPFPHGTQFFATVAEERGLKKRRVSNILTVGAHPFSDDSCLPSLDGEGKKGKKFGKRQAPFIELGNSQVDANAPPTVAPLPVIKELGHSSIVDEAFIQPAPGEQLVGAPPPTDGGFPTDPEFIPREGETDPSLSPETGSPAPIDGQPPQDEFNSSPDYGYGYDDKKEEEVKFDQHALDNCVSSCKSYYKWTPSYDHYSSSATYDAWLPEHTPEHVPDYKEEDYVWDEEDASKDEKYRDDWEDKYVDEKDKFDFEDKDKFEYKYGDQYKQDDHEVDFEDKKDKFDYDKEDKFDFEDKDKFEYHDKEDKFEYDNKDKFEYDDKEDKFEFDDDYSVDWKPHEPIDYKEYVKEEREKYKDDYLYNPERTWTREPVDADEWLANYYGTGEWVEVDDKGADGYDDESTSVKFDSWKEMVDHANSNFKAWSPKKEPQDYEY